MNETLNHYNSIIHLLKNKGIKTDNDTQKEILKIVLEIFKEGEKVGISQGVKFAEKQTKREEDIDRHFIKDMIIDLAERWADVDKADNCVITKDMGADYQNELRSHFKNNELWNKIKDSDKEFAMDLFIEEYYRLTENYSSF
jgi:hypothetical protein